MKHLFVIAAGGTGAKVVESLIHLCAAGMGPDDLDILLLDVDQSNGNVERTRETVEQYRKMRQWDWSINPLPASKGGSVPLAGTRFFGTPAELHVCLDEIGTVGDGGLEVHLRNEDGAKQLLDLLYDDAEQKSKCEKGFLARPNLGSLVLGGHLYDKFAANSGGAASFKARLLNAVNGATIANPVSLAVIGSIFGGTGASMFPVVCQRIKEAVNIGGTGNWDKIMPIAVMLTPYFLPNQSTEEGTVDPSRFLTDTANTLSHYAETDALQDFRAVYLVGSDQPQLNRLKFVDGAREQANPPFFEEVLAALATLDATTATPAQGRIRIFQPPGSYIEWTNLPFPDRGQGRLALLLELAAFLLLPAKAGQPLSGGLLDACDRWGDEFELLPLFQNVLGSWAKANFSHEYVEPSQLGEGWKRLVDENVITGGAAVSSAKSLVSEYAYRLLLWARTALPQNDQCRLIKLGEDMDYAVVWEVMCGLTAVEIEPSQAGSGTKDNALVRLARAAAAALAKIASGQIPRGGIINPLSQALPGFPGQGNQEARACSLPIDQNALKAVAAGRGIPESVLGKFTKTELETR